MLRETGHLGEPSAHAEPRRYNATGGGALRIRVRVPASTSNLGAGFDCFGLALDLGLTVDVDTAPVAPGVEFDGPVRPPAGEPNGVLRTLQQTLEEHGRSTAALYLRIRSEIPVARGLGSSAAATLAGLLAGQLAAGAEQPDLEAVLQAAVRLEGHPDNAAAALFGGFVASAVDGGRIHRVRLTFPSAIELVALIPAQPVETHRARSVLPDVVPLQDAVFNLQRAALQVGALAGGDLATWAAALDDRLHQERRLALVPGLGAAFAALRAEPGCLGAVVSGSGSTLLAFATAAGPAFGAEAVRALSRHGIEATVRRVRPSPQGATWTRDAPPEQRT